MHRWTEMTETGLRHFEDRVVFFACAAINPLGDHMVSNINVVEITA